MDLSSHSRGQSKDVIGRTDLSPRVLQAAKVGPDPTHSHHYLEASRLTDSTSVEIKEDHGTSNITVADETGFVVSITTTVGLNWGSRIMVPEYGLVLNDSMDDFSVKGRPNGTGYEPTKANYGESTANSGSSRHLRRVEC